MKIAMIAGIGIISFSVLLFFTQSICSESAHSEIIRIGSAGADDVLPDFLSRLYSAVKVDVKPDILQYELPLSTDNIPDFSSTASKLNLSQDAVEKLLANGFTVFPYGRTDDIIKPYKDLKDKEVPVIVTSDTLLYLFHIQFGETLREIEQREFYSDLVLITEKMLGRSIEQYRVFSGDLKRAAERNMAFFSVAMMLLNPQIKAVKEVEQIANMELELIKAHQGFSKSPLFSYREDYSQYVPRGHYTRSEELKRYFSAMMYYGRMAFLLKGHEKYGPESPPAEALVSPEEARIQTLQALLISAEAGCILENGKTVMELWRRIYTVTSYYSGFSDDLSLYEYRDAMRKVFGQEFDAEELSDNDKVLSIKRELALLPSPRIYGGTGESAIVLQPGQSLEEEQLDKMLDRTKGFRFMGQRYIPDSYMLGRMVSPSAGRFSGEGSPFTMIETPAGTLRGFPRGLDIMGILGSLRAFEILKEEGDLDYTDYEKALGEIRSTFSDISETEWNRNLYWSWLYALKILVSYDYSGNYPAFMKTAAWTDRQLNLALASWASLRHDTILYAKQSYTPAFGVTSHRPQPPAPMPVRGYVEPVPELYAHLLSMTRMTGTGLKKLDVLDSEAEERLCALEGILEKLLDISVRELKNIELTEDDYSYIRNFAQNLKGTTAGVDSEGMKTTMIADVHTDQNTRQVLEEGTGYVNLMVAACMLPDGHIMLGAGPVLSYYEFKHPMDDRLTDEKWRVMLLEGKGPSVPEWTGSFLSITR